MSGTTPPSAQNVSHAPPTSVLEHTEYTEADVEEPGMGEAQKVSLSSSPRMKLFALAINVLVLLELTLSMYLASLDPDRLTPIFFKTFFTMLVPTIVFAFIGRRLIARAERR